MNIGSNSSGVAKRLSNFTARRFIFDGVECYSMEGLLQSFKFKDEHIQVEVCKMIGFSAKQRGRSRNRVWQVEQKLWWKGQSYDRKSEKYQQLLTRAYDALATNENFLKDLLSTNDAVFTHSIGSNKESETVLTEREFCRQLTRLRREHANI